MRERLSSGDRVEALVVFGLRQKLAGRVDVQVVVQLVQIRVARLLQWRQKAAASIELLQHVEQLRVEWLSRLGRRLIRFWLAFRRRTLLLLLLNALPLSCGEVNL